MMTPTLSLRLNGALAIGGDWEYRLDPDDQGQSLGWPGERWEDRLPLPGSLDQAGVGEPNLDLEYLGGLSRKVRYTGSVWFATDVELPAAWRGRPLEIFLERVHWFSDVWVDGEHVGGSDSLSVPHRYPFTAKGSDRVRIVVRVDNTPRIPIGRIGHALTDWTQTNWNGIIGRMEIRPAGGPELRALPTATGLRVRGSGVPGESVRLVTPKGETAATVGSDGLFETTLDGSLLDVWDENSATLGSLKAVTAGGEVEIATAWRSFVAEGRQFRLNGRPTFLRGTLECCVFPKTGYPPMDPEPWREVMAKVREYGLNHVRFHSWCPPEAAFVAADEAGVLLQVELPLWTGTWPVSSDAKLLDFCRREGFRILDTYGHHPSFVLFTLGNEIAFYGEEPEIDAMLSEFKAHAPGILMNFSAQGTHLSPVCDYYVQADNGRPGPENRPLRGSTWFGVGSRFDREPPASTTVCDEAAACFDRPVVSHEVGEWAVFPNLAEESDYDGVLEPRNFATIRRRLRANGMEEQAAAFTQASGALSAALYKEEIETLLRTRGLAGYQLLGLTDFPGQGTATIGMLDAFWREKGFVEGAQFREFCAPTVPLMVAPRFVWTSDETLRVEARAFHTGDPATVAAEWTFAGKSGSLPEATLVLGETTLLGEIAIELGDLPAPARHEMVLTLPGLGRNRWPLWVFPPVGTPSPDSGADVFSWYREDVREALKAGRTVWLRMHPDRVWGGISGRFAPAFWSPIHFKEQVATMGTLIKKDSPLFADFPTEGHTEWHWWELLTRSKALDLSAFPKGFRPEVQVIDRYERNDKLGSMFSAQVGAGRLLVTFFDFDTPGRPAAAALERSIRRHLASGRFAPSQSLSLAHLDRVFELAP